MAPEFEEYTMDDLAEMHDDYEEVVEGAKSLMMPKGIYNTVPEVTFRLTHDKKGRKVFRATANVKGAITQKPENQEASGKEGLVFFGISPIPGYRDDGRADGPWKLWINARNLYADTHGLDRKEKISVPGVLDYLTNYPVALFITQGDDSNFINSISAPKEE